MTPLCSHLILLLIFVTIHPEAKADLKADKQALLKFAAAVPHGPRLNWNTNASVCNSWIGVSCSSDGTRIAALRLPGVGLYGPIPGNTLGRLDALEILSLRSNLLSGNIPLDVLSLPYLRYVYFQHNNFSDKIPSSLSPELNVIDLSFNSLTGNIPTTIQNLTHLTGLYLQNNSLTGPIPDIKFPRLKQLNMSNNHLNGSIPSSVQKFPASSFEGNSLLCGSPMKRCPSNALSPAPAISPSPSPFLSSPPPTSSPQSPSPPHLPSPPILPPKQAAKTKLGTGIIIAIAVGSFSALALLLFSMLCCMKKKTTESDAAATEAKVSTRGRGEKAKEDFGSGIQEADKNKLVFFEGYTSNFDLEDLLRASAEVLGKGSYGTAYKATLEEGTTVVVKRLKEVVVGKKEFEQQMEIIGRVCQHPNVVSLRAYYHSKDEKLLVYDYVEFGSLSTIMHAKAGNRESGRVLDWDSRLKICLGTARGISHIHSAAGQKLMHGNIKSSNVLLNQEFSGCISDFGLNPLMGLPIIPSKSAGYHAPEVIENRKPTQSSDVYSFGVLLLEMLTGKAPVQSTGHEDVVDLPRWVQSVVREEWTAEVFDADLLKYHNVEEEMVQMLQIAMACVSKVPALRPSMNEVARMIEEVQQSNYENRPSSEESKSRSPTSPALW